MFALEILKKEYNLTFSEFLVIQAIADLSNPTQQQVAKWSNLSKAMVSKVISELVTKKIASKSYSSKDKRSVTLILTKKGRLLSTKSSKLLENNFNKIAKESISDTEKSNLTKIIYKLNKAIENYI